MELTRRQFNSGITASFFSSIIGANDRPNLGFIGIGPPQDPEKNKPSGRGTQLINACISNKMISEKCNVVAVCDVFEPHLLAAADVVFEKTRKMPARYSDFRKLLENKDVDAVFIATPDHWHPYMTVEACRAGKDVYVEKPISVAINEDRLMREAQQKYGRVIQVGTQQRSGGLFLNAIKVVQSGILGRIDLVDAYKYGGFSMSPPYPENSDPPADLDWDMWLGPALKKPYNQNYCPYNFRWFWDYAGGAVSDWGAHLLDVVLWAMKETSPMMINAMGGNFCTQDNRETPDTVEVIYSFKNFICKFSHNCMDGYRAPTKRLSSEAYKKSLKQEIANGNHGVLFYGEFAKLFVNRSEYFVEPREGISIQDLQSEYGAIPISGSRRDYLDDGVMHVSNFLDCIKSRNEPAASLTNHHATAMCHLGNLAYRTQKTIFWNGEHKMIDPYWLHTHPNLQREYRSQWEIKV